MINGSRSANQSSDSCTNRRSASLRSPAFIRGCVARGSSERAGAGRMAAWGMSVLSGRARRVPERSVPSLTERLTVDTRIRIFGRINPTWRESCPREREKPRTVAGQTNCHHVDSAERFTSIAASRRVPAATGSPGGPPATTPTPPQPPHAQPPPTTPSAPQAQRTRTARPSWT